MCLLIELFLLLFCCTVSAARMKITIASKTMQAQNTWAMQKPQKLEPKCRQKRLFPGISPIPYYRNIYLQEKTYTGFTSTHQSYWNTQIVDVAPF